MKQEIWAQFIETVAIVLWLIVLTPALVVLHHLFSPRARRVSQDRFFMMPLLTLFRMLRHRVTNIDGTRRTIAVHMLLGLHISTSVLLLLWMPLAPAMGLTGGASLLAFGMLLLWQGVWQLAISVRARSRLTRAQSVEFFVARTSVVVVLLACGMAQAADPSETLAKLLEMQLGFGIRIWPSWGAFVSPAAWIMSLIAVALYTRIWLESESPNESRLIKPIESELHSTGYVLFKIARAIELVVLHAFMVVVFLAGPYLSTSDGTWWAQGILFTLKLGVSATLVLLIGQVAPRQLYESTVRVCVLWLLPTVIVIESFLDYWW